MSTPTEISTARIWLIISCVAGFAFLVGGAFGVTRGPSEAAKASAWAAMQHECKPEYHFVFERKSNPNDP